MVAVVMSTYNGSAFLQEQIDSILTQSYTDFVLYIRDDGSSDNTLKLLCSYKDQRIQLIQGNNIGPANSFFSLIRAAADADYLFFSDQDDVWYPDKLKVMIEKIQQYDHCPAMVFSDFSMIDETGKQINPSFAEYASLRVTAGSVNVKEIIPHPYVFGCASVINHKLAELIQTPPDDIEMHDCWIALTAAAIGQLVYIPIQTIAHRFHSSNATGRKNQNDLLVRLKRLFGGFASQATNTSLRLHQVNLLLKCYENQLIPSAKSLLTELSAAMARGRIATVLKLKKLKIGRQKSINTLFFYLTVLGIKGEIR